MKYAPDGFILVILVAFCSPGCAPTSARVADPTGLQAYVESAKRAGSESNNNEGSLWRNNAYRSNLFRDLKARYIDDVVTIRVLETTQAVASADAKNSKTTSSSAGFDNFFGAEKLIKEMPTMLSGKGSSSFEGEGSTSRATTLQTSLTARVIDVLPNGYLVVEGMREVHVNNENQRIYLTGVVRPEDIGSNNVVLSSSVAQMSVRLQGRGIVSQPIKPGWLFKILNGILPF
jgi:flagellar L-ring protein precursor FlgH